MSTSRFLIYCPIGVKTGGPECLYQLCDAINNLGFESLIVPSADTIHLAPCADFNKYKVKYLKNRELYPQDILIVPENSTRLPKRLAKSIHPSNLVVWWLSVDNSPLTPFHGFEERNHPISPLWMLEDLPLSKTEPLTFKQKCTNFLSLYRWRINRIHFYAMTSKIDLGSLRNHFAQSVYAQNIVSEKLGRNVKLLTDYVYGAECQKVPMVKSSGPKIKIAYNPFKGAKLMRTLISIFEDEVEFVELRDMNSAQVAQTLRESDLYLDLGHFPGKDRIPREAILEGCPVILAKRGAARNNQDFKLHTDYKVDLANTTPDNLKLRLLRLVDTYDLFEKQHEFFNQQTSSKQVFFSEVLEFIKTFNEINMERNK